MRDVLAGVDRQRLVQRFGTSAEAWCDALPALVETLCERWGLEVATMLPAGSNSVVLACGERVLKLTPDPTVAAEEDAALRAWAGLRHVVQLVDSDVPRGAVLLEAVRPGTSLAAAGWTLEDVAPVLTELRAVPAVPGSFGTLADRVEFVFGLFTTRLAGWPDVAARIAPAQLADAVALAGRLARGGDVGLLHGDLHPGNVLRGDTHAVAIDPRPCIGDRACDTVDWMLADVTDEDSLRARIDSLVALVPGLDGDRVRAWCSAFGVVVAASLLRRRPDDPVGEFALTLDASLSDRFA